MVLPKKRNSTKGGKAQTTHIETSVWPTHSTLTSVNRFHKFCSAYFTSSPNSPHFSHFFTSYNILVYYRCYTTAALLHGFINKIPLANLATNIFLLAFVVNDFVYILIDWLDNNQVLWARYSGCHLRNGIVKCSHNKWTKNNKIAQMLITK